MWLYLLREQFLLFSGNYIYLHLLCACTSYCPVYTPAKRNATPITAENTMKATGWIFGKSF